MDLKEKELELEEKYNKNQLIPRVSEEFKNDKDIQELIKDFNPKFAIDLLAKLCLYKRMNVPTMVGLMRHHFDSSQECADELARACEKDLCDFDTNTGTFIMLWDITKDVKDELALYQFPLPMVIKPKKLWNNKQTGYLKGTKSVILKDNYTTDDVCLDVINNLNSIPLEINVDVANNIPLQWKNMDRMLPGENWKKYQDRRKAFDKYKKDSLRVIKEITDTCECFFLTHAYDKRGRIYDRGYHINGQGNDWNKAVIEFHNKEVVQNV